MQTKALLKQVAEHIAEREGEREREREREKRERERERERELRHFFSQSIVFSSYSSHKSSMLQNKEISTHKKQVTPENHVNWLHRQGRTTYME